MHEMSKSVVRRMSMPGFVGKYFAGDGIDIGAGPDNLAQYSEQFPLMTSLRVWDLPDGDAQYMAGVDDETFDFVHSSHCLEHLRDPLEGLSNWLRILKPGGFLIGLVPDEDLYEQGQFPSTFNSDHKHTFTIFKTKSWSPKSINVVDLVSHLGAPIEVMHIQLLHSTFRYQMARFDQTLTPIGECAIEFVFRKRTTEEMDKGGQFQLSA
ncbi:MAG: class I SAM-dependent methyltransferase [Burkholderiales bacterium]|nr:class I SAM-dependent methyltransferase [Burkholderiales bacterium]